MDLSKHPPEAGAELPGCRTTGPSPPQPPNSGQACQVALSTVLVHKPLTGQGNPPRPLKRATSPFAYSFDLKRLSKVSHSSKTTDESKPCLIIPDFIGDHLTSDTPVGPLQPGVLDPMPPAAAPAPGRAQSESKACLSVTAIALGIGPTSSLPHLFTRNCNLLCHRNKLSGDLSHWDHPRSWVTKATDDSICIWHFQQL